MSVGARLSRREVRIQVPQEKSRRPPVQVQGQGAVEDEPVSLLHVFQLSSEHRERGGPERSELRVRTVNFWGAL